jgi:hypothetical protein
MSLDSVNELPLGFATRFSSTSESSSTCLSLPLLPTRNYPALHSMPLLLLGRNEIKCHWTCHTSNTSCNSIYCRKLLPLYYKNSFPEHHCITCKAKVEVKLSLCLTKHHNMKMHGGMEVFFTSALDRGEWPASRPGHPRYPFYSRPGGPQSGLDVVAKRKILVPTKNRNTIVH